MSTTANLPPTDAPVQPGAGEAPFADEAVLQLVDQEERVVNRLAAARGAFGGIIVGAALWAGLIAAGAALIRK